MNNTNDENRPLTEKETAMIDAAWERHKAARFGRTVALETRLLEFVDLCWENPLGGDEERDVAYGLIRQAAAEIASLRQRIEQCPARHSMHGCPASFLAKEREE
ncbi:hypothetical protein GRI72_03030 [Altererythrobacter marinus]|uniref:Uncharacterized protein n=1 Tax=Pelagerythrobacter marinus TaxID=538382 RepID=A0ABW9UV19_9SPHN|nr:hypothetical protein [Pelagerythrobacter marinus]MXO67806.1 hypothetical protein [Pelagerythrobacter marinus]